MKVKRNSWHYRVWNYKRTAYRSNVPPNLCRYFWMVIWKLFIGIPFIAVSPIFGFSMDEDCDMDIKGSGAWLFVAWTLSVWFGCLFSYLYLPFTGLSGFTCFTTWALGVLAVWIALIIYFEGSNPVSHSFADIVVETFKAKKQKVCPTIEVIE